MNIVVENVQGNMFPTTQSNFEKTADQKSLMGDKSKEFRSKILMYQKNPDIKSNLNQQMSIQMRLLKKKPKDNPKPAENTNHGRNQEVPGPTLPTVCTPSPKTVLNKEKGNAVKKP